MMQSSADRRSHNHSPVTTAVRAAMAQSMNAQDVLAAPAVLHAEVAGMCVDVGVTNVRDLAVVSGGPVDAVPACFAFDGRTRDLSRWPRS